MPAHDVEGRLWVLPGPEASLPRIERGHPLVALLLASASIAALVPVFLALEPESRWQPQDLFAVLLAGALVSFTAASRIRSSLTLDAGFALAMVGIVFLGPLPGACILAAPEISAWIERRRPIGFLSGLASCGWATVAATGALAAMGVAVPADSIPVLALPAVALAGYLLVGVEYLIGLLVVAAIHDGERPSAVARREWLSVAPAQLTLAVSAGAAALLYSEVGLAGLIPLAALAIGAPMFVPRIQARPIADMSHSEAVDLYTSAIGDVLQLSREEKRILADAASHLGDSPHLTRIEDFQRVMQIVIYSNERWDGEGGFPGTHSGNAIPIESRVLTVATAWSGLTAQGSQRLPPEEALHRLRARAGTEFDPRVVAAAVQAVRDELLPASPRGKGRPRAQSPSG